MGCISGTIPIVLNTHQGLRDVSQTYIKVAKSMRLTSRQTLAYILFPAAWPTIMGGLKLGLTY
jgi:nitrate/nitrite transport system permease protein